MKKKVLALECCLRACRNVITLGVRPDFSNYSPKDAELIRAADKIYYPSVFYADLFSASGKEIFPSANNYKFVQDKIKQTALFKILNLPHPKTSVFYGQKKYEKILGGFSFPFIAKIPRGSAMGRGVYLIKDKEDLLSYCQKTHAAYIQQYMPTDRDIRVVVIGKRAVHSYWRLSKDGEFRSNVARGGQVSLNPVPKQAVDLAVYAAGLCGWNDVGIDILPYKGDFYLIEGNMKYGKEGFRKAGIDYIEVMEDMIENSEI